MSIDFVK